MRSQLNFHHCHFENSINFPIEKCTDEFFLNWDPKNISANIIKNPIKKELFDSRRRNYIYIIASQADITNFLDKLPKVFDCEAMEAYLMKYA